MEDFSDRHHSLRYLASSLLWHPLLDSRILKGLKGAYFRRLNSLVVCFQDKLHRSQHQAACLGTSRISNLHQIFLGLNQPKATYSVNSQRKVVSWEVNKRNNLHKEVYLGHLLSLHKAVHFVRHHNLLKVLYLALRHNQHKQIYGVNHKHNRLAVHSVKQLQICLAVLVPTSPHNLKVDYSALRLQPHNLKPDYSALRLQPHNLNPDYSALQLQLAVYLVRAKLT